MLTALRHLTDLGVPARRVAVAACLTATAALLATPGADAVEAGESLAGAVGTAHLGPDQTLVPIADVVGVGVADDGSGYWLAAADGGVFSAGDVPFYGSAAGIGAQAPVVDIVPTEGGYWLAAADGGVFSFGDASFLGSAGDLDLAAPVIGMAATASGSGYWLAAVDGGVFSFGDAEFLGSAAGLIDGTHVVGIAAAPAGDGYWLATADGRVLSFGDARFRGDLRGTASDVQAIAATPDGGYLLVDAAGAIYAFGTADPGDAPDIEGLTVDIVAHPEGGALTARRAYDRPAPVVAPVDPNHPFLVCTRAHESDSAGGYTAVSASGTYRGAYQFSQATWDVTASHAGRHDLVGVDPAAAAPADQDFLALHLYQWRGAAPWLGRCAGL